MKTRCILSLLVVLLAISRANGDPRQTDPSVEKKQSANQVEWLRPGESVNQRLAELATQQKRNPEAFNRFQDDSRTSGSLVAVEADKRSYLLAVQMMVAGGVPGVARNQVVLLSPQGKILDYANCEINSRYGALTTDVYSRPQPDKAIAAIRFVGHNWPGHGQNMWHNWHRIEFRNKTYKFWEKEDYKPNVWDEKGLCRVGIADDKLAVLFPSLEIPDLRQARELRISYWRDGVERTVTFEGKALTELLETIKVAGAEAGTGGLDRHPKLTFLLPDGAAMEMTFATDGLLTGSAGPWGRIVLETSAFHEALAKAATQAEGRKVDLLKAQ